MCELMSRKVQLRVGGSRCFELSFVLKPEGNSDLLQRRKNIKVYGPYNSDLQS